MLKILHIGSDSPFIQFLSGVFEELAPNTSHYLITSADSKDTLRYPVRSDSVQILPRGLLGLVTIPWCVQKYDAIIVHGMSPYGVVAFLASPQRTVRVWSGWGYDYYGSQRDPDEGLLSQATQLLISEDNAKSDQHSLKSVFLQRIVEPGKGYAARRTDFFSAPIALDMEIFKNRFEEFSGEYLQLNYGNVSEMFANIAAASQGSNILVGNSASPSGNHIDILKILAKRDLAGRKVIVPLSYGDVAYRDKILNAGKHLLGDAFIPLLNILPFSEYRQIVGTCNIVIMNHYRQQALGNICAALHQGAHVYLNAANPIHKFLKKNSAFIRSTDELLNLPLPDNTLSEDELLINRNLLERYWGDQQVKKNVNFFLAKIAACRSPRCT